MNNTIVINIFDNDNSNIAYIKTQHHQIMANITHRILKFETMIKKPIVTNHIFFMLLLLATSIPSFKLIIL